ncbi:MULTISPECIES: hypothetical protein [unclassified Agarivorans]|uniref:hypothetical protein n=1 Tax=unclassified Agarivorans TaxID=2636026 RepID=UPI0026E24F6E|nr:MULTISPECIES: hypothetical protein [unclassified Agarivorans]MDO6685599.1 hypothetical protein [Agarivorans sp. 3_MG-2023]MDO6715985.1 hypothetical protein [Agarivorans sp. 2_MG-2023]MDO6765937.1 hypothetical protein [Agarivorans sp. 1_MG-2023]
MEQFDQRCIRVGDWIFEIKMVRAIRVSEYGQPYDACANINFNGTQAYIDSQLTRVDNAFSGKDFAAFVEFCQDMGITDATYDRYSQGKRRSRNITIGEDQRQSPKVVNFPASNI